MMQVQERVLSTLLQINSGLSERFYQTVCVRLAQYIHKLPIREAITRRTTASTTPTSEFDPSMATTPREGESNMLFFYTQQIYHEYICGQAARFSHAMSVLKYGLWKRLSFTEIYNQSWIFHTTRMSMS